MSKKLLVAERLILASLIILLPAQTGKHFWPAFAFINGIRIDYLSPTLYLTDILIIVIVLAALIRKRQKKEKKFLHWKSTVILGCCIFYILLNIKSSSRPALSLYSWLKLGLLTALFWYIKNEAAVVVKYLRRFLPLALTYSSLLAIAQVLNQASLSGPLYLLGERWFTIATPGIARTQALGRLLLRPYATFPHPNALAGFLVVSQIFLFFTGKKEDKQNAPANWIVLSLGSLVVALSFSQSAWYLATIAVIVQLLRKYQRKAIPWALALIAVALFIFLKVPPEKESLTQRKIVSEAALTMIKEDPATGVGLGNFIPNLDSRVQGNQTFSSPFLFYQPAHNVFLLWGAETGLIGLCALIWLFCKALQTAKKKDMQSAYFSLCSVLLLGLIDHYWFTLQQTRLLLTILLATSLSKSSHSVKIKQSL